MKKPFFVLFTILTFFINCQENTYDPWGVWDSYPVNINTAKIRNLKSGSCYVTGAYSGVYIVQDCRERVAGDLNFPAFAIAGEFNRIEKYEKIKEGFLFYLIGDGIRHNQNTGKTEFKDNMSIQVKMIFLGEDECKFEFQLHGNEDGFEFMIPVSENKIYRRYRVKD
jgi:hypothetical protein